MLLLIAVGSRGAGACVLLVEALGHRYINIRGSGGPREASLAPAGSDSACRTLLTVALAPLFVLAQTD